MNSPDGTRQRVNIPKQDYPPPGQCRIWTPGVLPQLQPAPGDCDHGVLLAPAARAVDQGEPLLEGNEAVIHADAHGWPPGTTASRSALTSNPGLRRE